MRNQINKRCVLRRQCGIKTFSVFSYSYRNTSGSLGEREIAPNQSSRFQNLIL